MLRYFIFIEYGLLPDLRVGVLISASQTVDKMHLNISVQVHSYHISFLVLR